MKAANEHQEQCALMRWANMSAYQYPELKWLFAVPNGGQRHPAVGAKLKAEGQKRGVPDLLFPVAKGKYHGLAIEMKTAKGRVSPEQQEWLEGLRKLGWKALVCRGWIEAKIEIERYISKPDKYVN